MGKQIRFFMTVSDEKRFVEECINRNNLILVSKRFINGEMAILGEDISEEPQIFITYPGSKINLFDSSYVINPTSSEVIEFSRCTEMGEKILDQGRLWIETNWREDGVLCKKSKIIVDSYNHIVKWLKKTYRISKDNNYYIGDDAFRLYSETGWKMRIGPICKAEF